jgi:hypothetical protein
MQDIHGNKTRQLGTHTVSPNQLVHSFGWAWDYFKRRWDLYQRAQFITSNEWPGALPGKSLAYLLLDLTDIDTDKDEQNYELYRVWCGIKVVWGTGESGLDAKFAQDCATDLNQEKLKAHISPLESIFI